jgi:hypothetical protein
MPPYLLCRKRHPYPSDGFHARNPHGLELYRPVSQTILNLGLDAGVVHTPRYHAIGLAVGLAVVLLLYHFSLAVQTRAPQWRAAARAFPDPHGRRGHLSVRHDRLTKQKSSKIVC